MLTHWQWFRFYNLLLYGVRVSVYRGKVGIFGISKTPKMWLIKGPLVVRDNSDGDDNNNKSTPLITSYFLTIFVYYPEWQTDRISDNRRVLKNIILFDMISICMYMLCTKRKHVEQNVFIKTSFYMILCRLQYRRVYNGWNLIYRFYLYTL